MEKKIFRFLNPDSTIQIILLLGFCGVTARFNLTAGLIELGLTLLYIYYIIAVRYRTRRKIKSYLSLITRELDTATRESFLNFPLPITVLRSDGSIIWYNERYLDIYAIKSGHQSKQAELEPFGAHIQDIIPDIDINIFLWHLYI